MIKLTNRNLSKNHDMLIFYSVVLIPNVASKKEFLDFGIFV